MVFALCDEEDLLGLLQSAVQLTAEEERRRRRQEIGKEKWGRWEGREGAEKESDKHSVKRLKAGMPREEEESNTDKQMI